MGNQDLNLIMHESYSKKKKNSNQNIFFFVKKLKNKNYYNIKQSQNILFGWPKKSLLLHLNSYA
jgi:hypothetical protein